MRPGSGGIQRGRGDAALHFGPASAAFEGSSFDVKRLTPAEFADLDQSTLVGVRATAPEVSGASGESAGVASVEASVGASAWKRRLEPRHRRAVSSFFGGQAASAGKASSGGDEKR